MYDLQQLQEIVNNKNVIFNKIGCPFCIAAQKLAEVLVEQKVLDEYLVLTLNEDFDNQTLTELVSKNGWQPDGIQFIATKPQIFIQGQYVGGNFDFYKSSYNTGSGKPNLKNPMRF
jgi:glutaredoxin